MMKDISDEDMPRVDVFTDSINAMNWHSACLFAICTLKRVMSVWDREVKKKYIIYGDYVVGLRHKISKSVLGEYLTFLESNLELWGIKEKVANPDILELWVALTDSDLELSTLKLSPIASWILIAVYELMCGVEKIENNNLQFVKSLARGAMIFEEWGAFEKFLSEVKADFINHPLYEKVQMKI